MPHQLLPLFPSSLSKLTAHKLQGLAAPVGDGEGTGLSFGLFLGADKGPACLVSVPSLASCPVQDVFY